MKRFICPTDFSAVSQNAVMYAADMAMATNAELLLQHTVEIPIIASEYTAMPELLDDLVKEAEQEMCTLSKKVVARTGNKITIHTNVKIGSLEYELEELCKQEPPFAIVMGTHSPGAAERFIVGSNTLHIVHSAYIPVLVVPQGVSFSGIKRIALAFDAKNEDIETATVEIIKKWVLTFGAEIDMVYVAPDNNIESTAVSGSVALEKALSQLKPHFHFVNKERVEEGLKEFISEHHPDLLIVIPQRHHFFSSLFHRSESKHLILHPGLPLLAIKE